MSRQGVILTAGVLAGLVYGWLTGAFIGLWPGSRDVPDAARALALTADGRPLEVATFAAGCFWCVESDFDAVPGVAATLSGFTGGRVPRPSYAQVSAGVTGHTEAVEVRFDPRRVRYEELLAHFWRNVDPFAADRQFCDRGTQYRPVIFTHSEAQRLAAVESKARLQAIFPEKIAVAIEPAGVFYPAEAYHQDYARTHTWPYRYYRWRCGRDQRLEAIWRTAQPR